MIFDVVISFVLAALSGLGVGGGGLFVIFLALFTDTPQLVAQGMNLLFFVFSASSSLIIRLTHNNSCRFGRFGRNFRNFCLREDRPKYSS